MIRIHEPALLIGPAPVVDLPKPTVIDHFFRKSDGGTTAIIMVHIVNNSGLFCGSVHRSSLPRAIAERLLAENVLPGFGRCNCCLGMHEGGQGNINDVDIVTLHNPLPVGLDFSPSPPIGKRLQIFFFPTTSNLQNRPVGRIKKLRCLAPSI